MSKHSKRKEIAILLFCVSLITLLWIFSNSIRDGASSTEQSARFTEWVRPAVERVLSLFDIKLTEAEFTHFIRKAAHFSEYALLGFLVMGGTLVFEFPGKKAPLLVFPFCLLCAAIDETIQVFSPGRGPSPTDVLLDFCGAVFGVCCCCVIYIICKSIRRKLVAGK